MVRARVLAGWALAPVNAACQGWWIARRASAMNSKDARCFLDTAHTHTHTFYAYN